FFMVRHSFYPFRVIKINIFFYYLFGSFACFGVAWGRAASKSAKCSKHRICPAALCIVESPKGVSPSGSHGTVLESLPSYGSSCLITKVSIPLRTCDTYGRTNFQCANKSGRLVYFICNHLIDAIL